MSTAKLTKPVLLLAFNDVDTTRRVLASIRDAQPPRLYFATDGPRPNRTEDVIKVNQVRELSSMVDWPCQLFTLHQPANLGCPQALQLAINWFFNSEESGIVLEHDMLPDPSFYNFCQILLDKYQNDESVMHIAGNSFRDHPIGEGDYYFSRIPIIWGWATWRRAWLKYDKDMSDWPSFRKGGLYKKTLPWWWARQKFTYVLDKVYSGKTNSWDYQWTYSLFKYGGLAICPNKNLITNIGFGPNALNSKDLNDPFAHIALESISFPLQDPLAKDCNSLSDRQFIGKIYKFNPVKVILRNLGLDLHKLLRR